jgi:hypothetical protein
MNIDHLADDAELETIEPAAPAKIDWFERVWAELERKARDHDDDAMNLLQWAAV